MNKSAKGLLWSFFGVLILSPDTLLIRLLNLSDFSLIFYRSFLPAISIFLFIFWMYKKETLKVFLLIGLPGIIYAMVLRNNACMLCLLNTKYVSSKYISYYCWSSYFRCFILNNFSKGKTISIYLGNNFCCSYQYVCDWLG